MDCIRKSTNAVVISHEKEATKRLFAAVRYYVDNMDNKPATSIDSAQEIKFPKRGSSYFIGTAGQKAFGRGDTVDRAHLSEAAFYPNLELILSGIAEAAEYGQIDIETTANGREHFYDMWQKAKKGLSPYTCIFIPWFMHEDYDSDKMTEAEKAGLSPAIQEMFAKDVKDFDITDEERALCERAQTEYKIEMTLGQLKWRRYKIWDKGELFFQEYPEDDESCFLQSGRAVFKQVTTNIKLRIRLDDIEKISEADRDRIFGNKTKNIRPKTLYAGIDPSAGTLEGDPHVLAIIEPMHPHVANNGAAVVYELVSNEPIDVFAFKAAQILRRLDVIVGVEMNGVGKAMCLALDKEEIPYEEWVTGGTNRPVMITTLEQAYRKQELIESYPEAENEARDMIYKTGDRAEHPNGKHDDRVFARAIALQMFNAPKPGITFL